MITLFTLAYPPLAAERPDQEDDFRIRAEAAASGKASAQRGLYERYYAYAMSIALHYAGQREEAEEITQDAFVKLFRQLTKSVPAGSVRAYFGRIIVNTAIDLIRKKKKQPFTETISDRVAVLNNSSRNTGTDRIQREEIYRLLQMLPPRYRLVFNLSVLEGYTHEQIAKQLGISPGTSKSNLSKARRKLRVLATTYYQIDESHYRE